MIINPKTNKPFSAEEKTALTEHQSKAYTTGVRTPSSSKSIATGLTPSKLASTLKNAANGSAEDYFILAEEMEERDLHYRSVLSTRKLAVTSIEPTVEAASDEAKDLELAEAVRQLLRHPQLPECMFDLLDGLGKGIGLVEILWHTETVPWLPRQFKWVDPRFIRLDKETLSEVRLVTDENQTEGEPLKPCGYLCHMPRMKSGHWLRNGLARLVAVMYMLKSYTVRDWWAFAEVFGMPIRVGKYHNNASPEDIRTLVNAIATIASDAGAAIPESMQIDMVETAKGNGGDTLFENMAEWADRQISKAVLGQTMTTDDGSSQSQAQVHNEVRKDIIKWDARQLANTLNEFLVKPFIDMNFGAQEQYPRIELNLEEAEDTKAWVEALTPLIDRGLKVQASDVRDRLGLGDPDKDAELLHPEGFFTPAAPALNHQLAMNRALRDIDTEQEINELVNSGLNDWQAVSAPMLNPVLDLVRSVNSFEEFSARLPELTNQMDSQAFIEQLTRLCWQARALGDVTDG
ncbi:DUF935 domain-containing protein [Photobacterium sp. WH24]|uniref:DUF935 domain-containing protein n=1 Tax=Photobacterium sp. WH24 TaxID=2827237 RepID=UPI001C476C59|nr:DUF935 domain-containing protein [Photobacterium sp. WH24]MBV7262572.1 DUF935 domain-containing protein [Photobacterium sp. WH24]